jgi:hypothetical protein
MTRSLLLVLTLPAALFCMTAVAPAGPGGSDRAEVIVAEGLEEQTRLRAIDERRSCDPGDAGRARALDRAMRDVLGDTEDRRTDLAASAWIGSPLDLSLAPVSLGAFQDDAVEADPIPVDAGPNKNIDYDHDGAAGSGDLAQAAQNPIADLISLPFQNNTNIDFGQLDYVQNVLNIQPVVPFNLNDEWNLITRTIIPVIYQPAAFSGDDHDFGISDVQFTSFFTPTKTFGGWMIGGGPVFRFPTATDERLGARKWALGPSLVFVKTQGPWLVGGLFQQVWSVAGSGDNDVSEFLVQPFVNYNIPDGDGWYLSSSPIITANWEADSDDRWTVPLGGGFGRVFRIGSQPVNCSLQGFYNVEKPDVVGDWTIRFQLQFLFPR